MPQENEVGIVKWWSTSKMPDEAVEEALDYLYFMQEVTNAYATELTWALALVLGLTCLYIWRMLGVQEAARLHSHMVNSRPVFSIIPTSTAASAPSSLFLSAYNNRFAHRDKGHVDERMNAVGYDVLHTCNQISYRHRLIPRAAWKRHSSGLENEQLQLQSRGGDRLWDGDNSGIAGHWNSPPKPGYSSTGPTSSYRRDNLTAAQRSRRVESPETYDVRSQRSKLSYPCNQQQQIQMQKVHQQMKERQNHLLSYKIAEDNSADDKLICRDAANPLRRRGTPSPPIRHPIPAPREEKKGSPSIKPRKNTFALHLEGQLAHRDQEPTKAMVSKDPQRGNAGEKDRPIAAKTGEKEGVIDSVSSAKYMDVVKDLKAKERKLRESASRSTDQIFTTCNLEKTREAPRHSCMEREVSPVPVMRSPERQLSPKITKALRVQPRRTPFGSAEQEAIERFRLDFLNHGDVLSRYKSASSFLETFTGSNMSKPIRRPPRAESDESKSHSKILDGAFSKEPKSKETLLEVRKGADFKVGRKRSKTAQKTASKSKVSKDVPKTAIKKEQLKSGDEPYDSEVLRAVKDEEAGQKALGSLDPIFSYTTKDGVKDVQKKAAGDAESERSNTVHEAGRRLAKLKKRLEESLENIQKQPGLDKELFEKARLAEMKRYKERLERMTFRHDEKEALDMGKNIENNPEVRLGKEQKSPVFKPFPEKHARKHSKDVWLSPRTTDDEKMEVDDGEPNASDKHRAMNSPKLIENLGTEKPEREKAHMQISPKFLDSPLTEEAGAENNFISARLKPRSLKVNEASSQLLTERTLPEVVHNKEAVKLEHQYPHTTEKDASAATCKLIAAEQPESSTACENITFCPSRIKHENLKSEIGNECLEQSKFLLRSGKILDEDSLDAILERQSKRRELLRQRKRNQPIVHLTSPKISRDEDISVDDNMESHDAETAVDKQEQQLKFSPDLKKMVSEEQHNIAKKEDHCMKLELKDQKLSPVALDGTCSFNVSKILRSEFDIKRETDDSEATGEIEKPVEDFSPLTTDGDSDISPYLSRRSLRHLKYEEPEVQLSTNSSRTEVRSSPEKLWNAESILGGERENAVRRRVRWRRQAEKAERQLAETESQKTPPPVPPKVTRLNDIVDKKWIFQENRPPDSRDLTPEEEATDSPKWSKPESSPHESKNPLPFEKAISDSEKGLPKATHARCTVQSPRFVRGSFICTVKDKNSVLAAGETGLVKGPPENVEICEEKSLTPSKAASVFDPKAQQEREKEKQEAERSVRLSKKEGMSSSQFKANLHLFEQKMGSAESPVPDSKVKANVKMFELEASRIRRAVSISPKRLEPTDCNSARSPSSQRIKPESSDTSIKQ